MRHKRKKINFNLGKIILLIAEKSFLFSVFFILVSLLVGIYLFYNYYYLPIKNEPQAAGNSLKIDERAYQSILSEWDSRQKKFESADYKNYINPFWSSEEKKE
jgi:hypothetical protein